MRSRMAKPLWNRAGNGPPGWRIRATKPSSVTQPMTSFSGSKKASTASRGVLPAKGDQHHHFDQLMVTWTIHLGFEFARIVAAQELLAAHLHQPAGLAVEVLV